jgi:DNA-binding HxlR family transcriptional regulator
MMVWSTAQRQATRRNAHVVAMAMCPGHRLLDRLGDKWVGLVLKELGDGPRRSGELARSIAGASQKMLTQTLRGLERDGLITRETSPSTSPAVNYQLTSLGASLLEAMQVLVHWAEQHIPDIDAARTAYAERQAAG